MDKDTAVLIKHCEAYDDYNNALTESLLKELENLNPEESSDVELGDTHG